MNNRPVPSFVLHRIHFVSDRFVFVLRTIELSCQKERQKTKIIEIAMGIKIGMRISIGIKYLFDIRGYNGGGPNDPVSGARTWRNLLDSFVWKSLKRCHSSLKYERYCF